MHPETFSIDFQRKNKARLIGEIEEKIWMELVRENELVENKELPISGYTFAAMSDRLKKGGVQVSTTTIGSRHSPLKLCQNVRSSKL